MLNEEKWEFIERTSKLRLVYKCKSCGIIYKFTEKDLRDGFPTCKRCICYTWYEFIIKKDYKAIANILRWRYRLKTLTQYPDELITHEEWRVKIKCERCENIIEVPIIEYDLEIRCPVCKDYNVLEESFKALLKIKFDDIEFNKKIDNRVVYSYSKKYNLVIDYIRLDKKQVRGENNALVELIEKNDLDVIQIMEDEWRFKRNIVLDRLNYLSHKTKIKKSAHKMKLEIIERFDGVWKKPIKTFLNKNVLYYNYKKMKIDFAVILKENNEIMAVMTFASYPELKNINKSIIMTSYVVKKDTVIRGNFEKMFKAVVKYIDNSKKYTNMDSIIVRNYYRLGKGGIFIKNKFEKINNRKKAALFYTNGIHRYYNIREEAKKGKSDKKFIKKDLIWRKIYGLPEQHYIYRLPRYYVMQNLRG